MIPVHMDPIPAFIFLLFAFHAFFCGLTHKNA